MRHHKPDIIVLLAVLVGVGILVTTAAQASEVGAGVTAGAFQFPDIGMSTAGHCLLCPVFGRLRIGTPLPVPAAAASDGDADLDDYPADLDFTHKTPTAARDREIRLDFLFNKFRAVKYLGKGSVDMTLRVDNLRTPAEVLDPYVAISFGGHW